MNIYLLFLFAIIATCRTDVVSWNRQVNSDSGLRLRNDLSRLSSLDGGGGYDVRSIGRSGDSAAYVSRAGLGQAVYVGRTNGQNDNSYSLLRTGGVGPGSNPILTSQNTNAWRAGYPNSEAGGARPSGPVLRAYNDNIGGSAVASKASSINKDMNNWNRVDSPSDSRATRLARSSPLINLGQRMYIGRTNNLEGGYADLANDFDKRNLIGRSGGYGQENYLDRANSISLTDEVTNTDLVGTVPLVRAGSYDQENFPNTADETNLGSDPEKLIFQILDRTAPAMRSGNYDQLSYFNSLDGIIPDAAGIPRSDVDDDIDGSGLFDETEIGRHGYSHPDPEIERNPRHSYGPSFGSTTEKNGYSHEDKFKKIIAKKYSPVKSISGYGTINDGYPNDSNGMPYDNYDGSDDSPMMLNNGYDYNALPPEPDSFSGNDKQLFAIPKQSKHKVPNSAIIAAYNSSDNENMYNSSLDEQSATYDHGALDDRFGLDHRGFHNTDFTVSDEINDMMDNSPSMVEINSNSGQINDGCYCSTNTNGQRVCNCDYNQQNQCEGGNCHRVTHSSTTTTTTCDVCKAKEAPKPPPCEQCKAKQQQAVNTCESCKVKQQQVVNTCESCKVKQQQVVNTCESCKAKEVNICDQCKVKQQQVLNTCESCKAKEVNICDQCKVKQQQVVNTCDICKAKQPAPNPCEQCKVKETFSECKQKTEQSCNCCCNCNCCNSGCGCAKTQSCTCGCSKTSSETNSCKCNQQVKQTTTTTNNCACSIPKKPACNCETGYDSGEFLSNTGGDYNNYNNYYNGGAGSYGGGSAHANAYVGAYGGGQITGRGTTITEHTSGGSGGGSGSISVYSDTNGLEDSKNSINSITSSNSGSSGSSSGSMGAAYSSGGGSSMSSAKVYASAGGYSGGAAGAYNNVNNLFSSFGTGFNNHLMGAHAATIFGR